MPASKLTDLPAITPPLALASLLYTVQGGTQQKTTVQQVVDAVSAALPPPSGDMSIVAVATDTLTIDAANANTYLGNIARFTHPNGCAVTLADDVPAGWNMYAEQVNAAGPVTFIATDLYNWQDHTQTAGEGAVVLLYCASNSGADARYTLTGDTVGGFRGILGRDYPSLGSGIWGNEVPALPGQWFGALALAFVGRLDLKTGVITTISLAGYSIPHVYLPGCELLVGGFSGSPYGFDWYDPVAGTHGEVTWLVPYTGVTARGIVYLPGAALYVIAVGTHQFMVRNADFTLNSIPSIPAFPTGGGAFDTAVNGGGDRACWVGTKVAAAVTNVVCFDGLVELWRRSDLPVATRAANSNIARVGYDPQRGEFIVTTGNGVFFLDELTGATTRSIAGWEGDGVAFDVAGRIIVVARIAAGAGERTIRLYDADTLDLMLATIDIAPNPQDCGAIGYSASGRLLYRYTPGNITRQILR